MEITTEFLNNIEGRPEWLGLWVNKDGSPATAWCDRASIGFDPHGDLQVCVESFHWTPAQLLELALYARRVEIEIGCRTGVDGAHRMNHVTLALERRFGGRSWMSSTEVEVLKLTGPNSQIFRRFDFVAANVCAGHSFSVVGAEVKVSRQDFLAEQRDPSKFATLRAMTHVAYYAAPKGLIKKQELPEGAGLLELQADGRLREVVKPAKNAQADVALVLAGLLRRSYAPALQSTLAAIRDELGIKNVSVTGYPDPDWWISQLRRRMKVGAP